MELVDIVDKKNHIIGQIDKQKSHKTGELHRCVIAELIDSLGNWYLVKQASDRQDAGQYVSPVGGHVTAGEKSLDALKRETAEEVGIIKFKHRSIGQAIFERKVKRLDENGLEYLSHENHYFLVFEIYSDQKPIINHESVAIRKFSLDEIKKYLIEEPSLFGDAFHFVVKKFYPHLLK